MKGVVSWAGFVTVRPIYIFGRYRKFARDVPQAPWTVAPRSSVEKIVTRNKEIEGIEYNEDEEREMKQRDEEECKGREEEDQGNGCSTKVRRGRNSVQEIVAEAICTTLGARECRMHPCGREDIDVRVILIILPLLPAMIHSQKFIF